MPEGGGSKGSVLPEGSVKWLVLGLVIVIAMLLFRHEISDLLSRTTDLKIGGGGLEIKTAETVLGTTQVTNVPFKPQSGQPEGVQGNTYASVRYGFRIRWPADGQWTASETYGQQLLAEMGFPPNIQVPVVILKQFLENGFRINVNVVVTVTGSS